MTKIKKKQAEVSMDVVNLKKAIQLLTEAYQRPTEPAIRKKILTFLVDLDRDPRHTGL